MKKQILRFLGNVVAVTFAVTCWVHGLKVGNSVFNVIGLAIIGIVIKCNCNVKETIHD